MTAIRAASAPAAEALSVLDMFKVGVGLLTHDTRSSHTLGPWRAAAAFVAELGDDLQELQRIEIHLFGALAKTGTGHGTDVALMMGLMGSDPVSCDTAAIAATVREIRSTHQLSLAGGKIIDFDPQRDIHFEGATVLPFHPNAMRIRAHVTAGDVIEQTCYSVGGGFIVREGETSSGASPPARELPYPIERAADLAHWCEQSGKAISAVVAANELAWRPEQETAQAIAAIWTVMRDCVFNGCRSEGELPGGLRLQRRAAGMARGLLDAAPAQDWWQWREQIRAAGDHFDRTLSWVSCFALAVNEENAAFGRVVTAPTNG